MNASYTLTLAADIVVTQSACSSTYWHVYLFLYTNNVVPLVFVCLCAQALAVLDGLVLQGTDTLDVKDIAAVSPFNRIESNRNQH
jgi:hypothetical protein